MGGTRREKIGKQKNHEFCALSIENHIHEIHLTNSLENVIHNEYCGT